MTKLIALAVTIQALMVPILGHAAPSLESTFASHELGLVNGLLAELAHSPVNIAPTDQTPSHYLKPLEIDHAAIAVFSDNQMPGHLLSKLQLVMDKIDTNENKENSWTAQYLYQFAASIIILKWINEGHLPVDLRLQEKLKDYALVSLRGFMVTDTFDSSQGISEGGIRSLRETFALFNSDFDKKLAQDLISRWNSAHPEFTKNGNRRNKIKVTLKKTAQGLTAHFTPSQWRSDYLPYGAFINFFSWAGVALTVTGFSFSAPWLYVPGLLANGFVWANIGAATAGDVKRTTRYGKYVHNQRLVGESILRGLYLEKKSNICISGLLAL